ncbi:COG4315 family predicted lipoprotein [Devosia sp.]|uniref:COG4315 family predicted lipoprotein n=1 Tax=Devosia sp. TaxID=1871048 RepID=UPI002FC7BE31
MKFRSILAGAAALALFAMPAFATDYLGGAVKSTDIGGKMVLTDANGMTLYIFDKDAPGVSNCYEQCAINWPPLMADAAAMAEGEFSVVDRTDGTKMWAYKSMPLYYWMDDKAPGDITGDGVGGVWHLAIE